MAKRGLFSDLRTMLFFVVIAVFGCGALQAADVASPDGNIVITAGVKDADGQSGCLFWKVSYKGKAVLADFEAFKKKEQ